MRARLFGLLIILALLCQAALPSYAAAPRHPRVHRLWAVWTTGYLWTGNRTATGIWPHWGVVAVDPRVIPLGARLRISGLPGVFVAADTGGAIQGARVDVFCGSLGQAYALTGTHAVVWWT